MSTSEYVGGLIRAAQMYSSYIMYIILIVGLTGNVLNILVFTNLKIFRLNRCAFYLIAESVVNIAQLGQIFINEMWKLNTNGAEPVNISLVWCKLRTMLPQWFRLMLASIVCFTAIDQFLFTNHAPHLRQLSSLKMAKYQVSFATFLCFLHTIPFGVFLQIHPSLGCTVNNTSLTKYLSHFYYPILNGLFPIFISSFFSILAYRNVRRIVRRQISVDRRKLDQQMTAMIFVRVIFFVLLQLPFTIYRIVQLNLTIIRANTLENAIHQWIQAISTSLVYINHVISFYIFLATSSRYRHQVKYYFIKKCWQSLKQKYHGRQNIIHPSGGISIESGTEVG